MRFLYNHRLHLEIISWNFKLIYRDTIEGENYLSVLCIDLFLIRDNYYFEPSYVYSAICYRFHRFWTSYSAF